MSPACAALLTIQREAEYARDQRGEIVATLSAPQRQALAAELCALVDMGTTRAHLYQTLATRAQAAIIALDAPPPRERASVAWEQSILLLTSGDDVDLDTALAALDAAANPDDSPIF